MASTAGSMASSSRARLLPVDGLRGIAAMIVVLSHIYAAAGYPYLGLNSVASGLDFLHSGVDLFFVLSGFCLFYPLTKPGSGQDWPQFFRRRARRLLPPYYAALCAVVTLPFAIAPLAHWLGLVTSAPQWPDWRQVWTHALLLHTLAPDTFFGLNGPFWSLGIEVQFYFAFPLAVWLMFRLGWRAIILLAMLTLAYRLALLSTGLAAVPWPFDVLDLFPSRWAEFALGMLVALRSRAAGDRPLGAGRELTDLAGAVCLFLVASFFMYGPARQWPFPPKDLLFAGLYSVLLYMACAYGSRSGRLLAHPVLVWLGTISYSIYLIHLPIVFALGPTVMALGLGKLASLLVMALVCLPAVLACSALFFRLFERPFLNTQPATSRPLAGPLWLPGRRAAQRPMAVAAGSWIGEHGDRPLAEGTEARPMYHGRGAAELGLPIRD